MRLHRLASLGYFVCVPNFAGSTGFGPVLMDQALALALALSAAPALALALVPNPNPKSNPKSKPKTRT